MPSIAESLPPTRLAAIKNHMNSDSFRQKYKQALVDIRRFVKQPGVNQDVAPSVWISYGKDSMALQLLCEEAEIEYEPCFIDNALEIPQHYTVVSEFDNWLGQGPARTYVTEHKGIGYLSIAIAECNEIRREKGNPSKPPNLDFFNPEEAYDLFYDLAIGHYHWEKVGNDRDTLHMWSTRACEGMGRQWELNKNGKMFQPSFTKNSKKVPPIWRSLPIGDWQDLDVWAYLLSWDCPISPVYGMNAITQRGQGRNYWPRTLWYCDPHVFSIPFVKWLKRYAPASLSEVMEYFPEVKAKLTAAPKQAIAKSA